MNFRRALVSAIVALTGLVFAYAYQVPTLPEPVPTDGDVRLFSGQRALAHIERIAVEPRPTGSPGLARARTYLIQTLRSTSPRFQIETQEALVVESFVPGIASATRVKNIVARLPGTDDSGRPLLLLAHYDTVVNAPGANDDGAGIATVLELVRALVERGPRRNDLIVLFTDGEERGMLGARAYYQQHSRGREPAIVFNFEARGNSGPALLFQSGPDSAWLVREFARFAQDPAASSVAQELFRILPYGTDFSVFAKGGLPGLNFAYINNTIYYHSAFDTPESVDVRSLQHHGENVLELLAHLAEQDLSALRDAPGESDGPAAAPRSRTPTYFLFGERLVVYASAWNACLLALAWLLYLIFFAGELARRPLAFLRNFFAPVWIGLASALSVWIVWRGIVLTLYPDLVATLPMGETYRAGWIKAGLQCVGLACGLWMYVKCFAGRARSPVEFMSGSLAFWLAAATLCVAYAPGAAYLFVWPLLFVMPLWALVRLRRGDGPLLSGDLPVLLLALPALAILFAPIVRFLFFGLLSTTTQPLTMLVYSPWLAWLALPLAATSARRLRRGVLACFVLAAGVGIIGGGQAAAFGNHQPRPNSLFYVYDAGENRLARFSCDSRLDAWVRGQLEPPAGVDRIRGSVASESNQAPSLAEFLPILRACLPGLRQPVGVHLDGAAWRRSGVQGPLAELLSSEILPNGDHSITLRIRSRRGAPGVYAFVRSTGMIEDARIDGVAVPVSRFAAGKSDPGPVGILMRRLARRVFGRAVDFAGWSGVMLASSGRSDFQLSFRVSGSDPKPGPIGDEVRDRIEVRLVDHTNGLPAVGAPPTPRTQAMYPGGRFPFTDGVFVVQSYGF
ncbi:MAG: M20/M25/M40 family metallo-hydrolase [bacterium]|nr:M20/M25/M40 family metallo-hydrolase [bacterium]